MIATYRQPALSPLVELGVVRVIVTVHGAGYSQGIWHGVQPRYMVRVIAMVHGAGESHGTCHGSYSYSTWREP